MPVMKRDQDYRVVDVGTVTLSQVMGVLSFMFLAMAAGAFLVPPRYFLPAVIIEFVLLFIIPAVTRRDAARDRSPAAGLSGALALAFAACAGAVLGPVVQPLAATQAGLNVLVQAALVSFAVFASFGAYGMLTRRNLNVLAGALFVGLLVLLGLMLLSIFFSRFFSPFGLAVGIGGALLFSLMTALDFQRAKHAGADSAVLVALAIFLDFVNLFTFVLDIFLIFSGGGLRRR